MGEETGQVQLQGLNDDAPSMQPSAIRSSLSTPPLVSKTPNKCWIPIITVFGIIVTIILLVLVIFYATKPSSETLIYSYSYCDTYDECNVSVQKYATIMNHTDGFFGPACASNNLLGRFITRSAFTDTTWQPNTLRNSGRIAFAVGPEMLSRILVMGDDKATNIANQLGYGATFTCGTPAKNYTDCQYRLIVWAVPCPLDGPPLVQGFWDNLEGFWRNYTYHELTPDLDSAISTIKAAKGLLQDFTGCDPTTLNINPYNVTIQKLANCTQEFIDAMAYFNLAPCNGTDASNPLYTPNTGCPPEQKFLALKTPTAAQLRAFLMQVEGFNPFYTGYGFTSNDGFYDPLQVEYWYPNNYLSALDNVTVITVYNGTAMGWD